LAVSEIRPPQVTLCRHMAALAFIERYTEADVEGHENSRAEAVMIDLIEDARDGEFDR
jgi:hypothetical protein